MSVLESSPRLHHCGLQTTFCGTVHRQSTPDAPINQYLGIKYASIPARFRQSHICSVGSYPEVTNASKHGPICPQIRKSKSPEELLFGIPQNEIPVQEFKQDEFECLNLNITCPAGLTLHSRIPVMLWVHGGGDKGSGSEWYHDGGAIVRKGILTDKPVIFVTFNFRIGLLGFATSNIIRDDNKAAGEEGTGNYGLRDQRKVMEWLHHHITEFGGDPSNITLIGSGSGAADIVCHLLSKSNIYKPLFSRAIIQSPIFEPILQDVSSAGWHLSRVMSALQVSCVDKFRKVDVEKLVGLGQNIRAVDDGVWFREGWQTWFVPKEGAHEQHHHRETRHQGPAWMRAARVGGMGVSSSLSPGFASTSVNNSRTPSRTHTPGPEGLSTFVHPLQPVIIGDCASESLLWSHPISLWTSAGVVRRLKAICQSLSKTTGILRAYDISTYTPDEEIMERVLELVDDARVKWPTNILAEAILRDANQSDEEGAAKGKVWRYVFDQEGPARGIPHHSADLMYLFDWKPARLGLGALGEVSASAETLFKEKSEWDGFGYGGCWDGPFDVDGEEEENEKAVVSHNPPSLGSMSFEAALAAAAEAAAACAAANAPRLDPHALASSIKNSSSATPTVLGSGPVTSSSSSEMIPTPPISNDDPYWLMTSVDRYAYVRVRDTMQEKWLGFAYGESPWTPWRGDEQQQQPLSPLTTPTPASVHTGATVSAANHAPAPEKVFVFGPEGETGERSRAIFEGRRRRGAWADVLEPLGWNVVQKFGVELSRGPALGADRAR